MQILILFVFVIALGLLYRFRQDRIHQAQQNGPVLQVFEHVTLKVVIDENDVAHVFAREKRSHLMMRPKGTFDLRKTTALTIEQDGFFGKEKARITGPDGYQFEFEAFDASLLFPAWINERISELPPASAAPHRNEFTSGHSVAEELKRLNDLKDAGALSDEEFSAAKAQVLDA